jgi:arylsulfatase A-like enzyme
VADNTTYSVAGDHGGIQRATQQIPIIFAGGGVSRTDLREPIRSVDIMPTVLRHLGIPVSHPMDGIGYELPQD